MSMAHGTAFEASSASFGTPLKPAKSLRCSSQVIVSHRTSCCGQTPRQRWTWHHIALQDRYKWPNSAVQLKLNSFETPSVFSPSWATLSTCNHEGDSVLPSLNHNMPKKSQDLKILSESLHNVAQKQKNEPPMSRLRAVATVAPPRVDPSRRRSSDRCWEESNHRAFQASSSSLSHRAIEPSSHQVITSQLATLPACTVVAQECKDFTLVHHLNPSISKWPILQSRLLEKYCLTLKNDEKWIESQ